MIDLKQFLRMIFVPSTDSLIFYFWILAAVVAWTSKYFLGNSLENKYKFQINAPKHHKVCMLVLSMIFSVSCLILLYSSYSIAIRKIDDQWLFLAAKFNLFIMMISWGVGPTLSSFELFIVKNVDEISDKNEKVFWKMIRSMIYFEIFFMFLSFLSLLCFVCIFVITL